MEQQQENTQQDEFEYEKPFSQHLLTENGSIISQNVDFSNYTQINYSQINRYNLDHFFKGILNYIFIQSEYKLNTNELEFHFTDARNRKSLTILKNQTQMNCYDIINIFNYQNASDQFMINSYENAFFGLKFRRIVIKPTFYSIRSGQINKDFLISFIFEAFDCDNNCWVVLDERVNINDLNFDGAYMMFFVRKTEKFYSAFRIRQIDVSGNGNWGFSISAFEIHGEIDYNDDVKSCS